MSFLLTPGVLQQQANRAQKKQYALEFDGVDDYVEFPRLLTSNTWTVQINITNNRDGGEFPFWTQYEYNPEDDSRFVFACQSSQNSIFQDGRWFRFGNTYIGNQIHTLSVDNGFLEYYIDGLKIGEKSNLITPQDTLFLIGESWTVTADNFLGLFKDVQAWNTARTQQQILDNLDKKLTGNETGLVAYYDFTEGSGNILHDKTGNGNDGTIYGANWIEI